VVPAARRDPAGPVRRDFYVWSDTPSATRTRASSSRTPRRRTGPGTRSPAPTTGTASSPTSPTSTSTTRRVQEAMLEVAATSGSTWASTASARRRALPVRARGHQLREPARDARLPARVRATSTRATPTACCWPRPTSGPRTSSPTSATATSATWRSTSRSCRACSWRVRGGPLPDLDILARRRPIPATLPVGLFLRNHDELTLEMVTDEERDYMYREYAKTRGCGQPRHPPPARAAAGQRPRADRAVERAAASRCPARRSLLRRRDRHGRQHLPRRPRRRAHADAVDADRNAGFCARCRPTCANGAGSGRRRGGSRTSACAT
jgi:hypothetical protein